jgi:hypothetical protein
MNATERFPSPPRLKRSRGEVFVLHVVAEALAAVNMAPVKAVI